MALHKILDRILGRILGLVSLAIYFFFATIGFASSNLASPALQDLLLDSKNINYIQHFDYGENRPAESPLFSQASISNQRALIKKYQAIVLAGGWQPLPEEAGILALNCNNSFVSLLRQRLIISHDLSKDAGLSTNFDLYVKLAVQKFQQRCGLETSGIVEAKTRKALNVSAQKRLAQLRKNLQRLLAKQALIESQSRYICVNIPSLQIEAVEHGKVVQYHKAVVGQVNRQTPVLDSDIYQIILNPYWTVPSSIARKDLLPLLQKDPQYLQRNNIILYNLHGKQLDISNINWQTIDITELRFRQEPGKENAMASTKLNFHNNYDVYMHDTPEQEVFNIARRFESSGCVRVHNIRDLNMWLLKNNFDWSRLRLQKAIDSRKNCVINLKDKVGVHFVYITAWAQDKNTANFRDDVYGFDN